MARVEWAHNGRYSCKRTTLIVCSANIVVALYVLHSLYRSLHAYPIIDNETTFEYTENQIRKMEEANQIRKTLEPTELVKVIYCLWLKVTQLRKRFKREERVVVLPQHLKQKFIREILDRLRSLDAAANATQRQEAIESWGKKKLKEAKKLIHGKTLNSTILPEEASAVKSALSSNWAMLSKEFGLWTPVAIINQEHNDKPEDEEDYEDEILPGRKLPPECHGELHTDYDGAAIRWGLTHPKESAYDCCRACLDQAKHAKSGEKKCNVWVYCPSETGCYSPDIYEHKNQECWLKYSETPKLNFKDKYPQSYRDRHPNAPLIVPWVSGVVSV